MGHPERTLDRRRRPEPWIRVALSGWYDPDSATFDAHAHEAARRPIEPPRRERDAESIVLERA